MRVALIGTVGVPARYGGFETLCQGLIEHWRDDDFTFEVYCERGAYDKGERKAEFDGCHRVFLPVRATGAQSLLYDLMAIFHAIVFARAQVLVCLGASSTLAFPLVRLACPTTRILYNVDGLESRRQKWSASIQVLLSLLDSIGIRFAHAVIADNRVIRSIIYKKYGVKSEVIAYGGSHVRLEVGHEVSKTTRRFQTLPDKFFLAISRVEPENNIHTILEAFRNNSDFPIVYVGNWSNSEYGRGLKHKHQSNKNIYLLDPIYNQEDLNFLRARAVACVHGHSVGGTNPALVEAIYWADHILAFDCGFNRATLNSDYDYWDDAASLERLIANPSDWKKPIGERKFAHQDRYSWDKIVALYRALILRV